MVTRTIEIDEQSDKLLAELALDNDGDLGITVVELLEAREAMEHEADRREKGNEGYLEAQREKSKASFVDGNSTAWETLRHRLRL